MLFLIWVTSVWTRCASFRACQLVNHAPSAAIAATSAAIAFIYLVMRSNIVFRQQQGNHFLRRRAHRRAQITETDEREWLYRQRSPILSVQVRRSLRANAIGL